MGLADKLPKTFTASNREKTKSLKRRIQDDVKTPQVSSTNSTIPRKIIVIKTSIEQDFEIITAIIFSSKM